jgi:hypothetical protein
MADAGLDFALAIWVLGATGHGDRTVMREHIAVERIESGIVDVRDEHALAQIVEDDDAGGATESAKRLLVQFSPDAGAGAEGQQTNGFRAPSGRCRNRPALPGRER